MRFSSSEAAAKMLNKARLEESHVKTVSLARGTVMTPMFHNTLNTRAHSDRSSIARSVSPDFTANSESPIGLISSIGVVEFLEQDERPTFIIDLGDDSNHENGPLRPIFINPSLRALPGLFEMISGQSDQIQQATAQDTDEKQSFAQFRTWLMSATVNGESLNVCLPPFRYAGLSWSCSTLRKRLRLLSGAFLLDDSLPECKFFKALHVTQTTPGSQMPPSLGSINEVQDYFGDAGSTKKLSRQRVSSSDVLLSNELGRPTSHSNRTGDVSLTSDTNVVEYSPEPFSIQPSQSYDWTRIPINDNMPEHIKFARSVDWAATSLGPIEDWSADLRQMCNLVMASPHPAAMYWGEDYVAIYNEAYVLLAGQKHPELMGMSYKVAWKEIWSEVQEVFESAKKTGEATMKDDDCLFINRNGVLEESYFSWSIIPLVGLDGTVQGLYNPCFEKTRRKVAERRMLTLREVGERTAAARDIRGFWQEVLGALEQNEYDSPLVLLYSVSDSPDSDASSMQSESQVSAMHCHREGTLGVPEGHPAAPAMIDLKSGNEGFAQVFREAAKADGPLLLEAGTSELPASLLEGLEPRGFGDSCKAVVVCPIHPTTGDAILGFLVLGVNSRRPYDEDYVLFLQLLSRQLATSLASVVLFEEEIRRGRRAARIAALDRIELSEQLAARTKEAIESETKFTRMAEFAPVGMFIANSYGKITYCNDTWYEISGVTKDVSILKWMDDIYDEDRNMVARHWRELIRDKRQITLAFRFKKPWDKQDGSFGERWVLFAAYPEKDADGELKSVFGSFTDISRQKWAEDFQKRKMEEAVELKRQQEDFIDITSHEMRNPLSAILQCSDEITSTIVKVKNNAVIKSYISAAGGGDVVDEVETALSGAIEASQIIALCAQHQKRIVDDVLTLSKIDSQLLLVTPVDSQPLTIVQRCLKMHEGECMSNDIQLKFVVDPSFNDLNIDWVRLDPSRVLQVLINLTTNAIKFTTTEQKRLIMVTLAASTQRPSKPSHDGDDVSFFPTRQPEKAENPGSAGADWGDGEVIFIRFDVRDTGRGLTEEESKLLFLRFSQASPRTHVQYGGSGLGLFICRHLTELQGGEIGMASEAGVGSTFAFYVRATRSKGPPEDHQTSISKEISGVSTNRSAINELGKQVTKIGTKYILLVEDNLVNQRVLQKQLKNLGCVVQVANHGQEALDRLVESTWSCSDNVGADGKKSHLSVVLMDQEMPVMDGLTAIKRIRAMEAAGELYGHIPVIAVTANARSEQIQTAMDAGMVCISFFLVMSMSEYNYANLVF